MRRCRLTAAEWRSHAIRPKGPATFDIYDLQTGRLTRITEGEQWVQSDWLNSRQLFVLVGRGNDVELWLHNANGSGGRRLLPAVTSFERMDYAAGTLAVQMPSGSHNLIRHGRNGATPVAAGSQADRSADFSKDGVLAFVRFGAGNWLYLQRPGEQRRRFVALNNAYPRGLRWSPDGRRIAYVGVHEGGSRLFIVDATSGVITPVRTPPDHEPSDVAWSMDGAALLYIDSLVAGRVTRVALTGEAAETISEAGWEDVMDTPEGVIAARSEEPGLWRLRSGAEPELVHAAYIRFRPVRERDWTIVNGTLYTIERAADGQPRVMAAALGRRDTRAIAVIEGAPGDGFAVDPRTGDIVYAIEAEQQADIGLVRLRRR